MRAFYTILLLVLSNTFMTFAWYGQLKFKDMTSSQNLGLVAIILISWGIALFEYILQVPANRIGFKNYGGPFSLVELNPELSLEYKIRLKKMTNPDGNRQECQD